MPHSFARPIAIATLVSGTLDIAFAMIMKVALKGAVPDMLRFVASGPFPGAMTMDTAGAVLGLVVHYALMAIMAAVFMLLVSRQSQLVDRPYLIAIGFGLITYAIMNWLVVPLRFDRPLPPSALAIVTQLFAHIVLVGLPFAVIAKRHLRRP